MNRPAAEKKEKARYKGTLNLPRTSFPMKANLVQNEPASLKRWGSMDVYARLLEERKDAERFVFHDGPPYANGSIHLGHLLNKCLKDFVVRVQFMNGRNCPFVPGWDCHGLPIEHKVMQEMSESGKLQKLADLPDDTRRMAIRRACRTYAEKYIKLQRGQMERLLTIADYDDPYLTMTASYEGAVLEVFASLIEQGLVYRQLKSVHWSIANETALADAELEYYDREDISVYVDFEAADAPAVYNAFGLAPDAAPERTPCFMIWTTTPWTLPANVAIAVNERFEYSLVRAEGNITILASELVEKVFTRDGADGFEVLGTCSGKALLGLSYRHPFFEGGPSFDLLAEEAVRHAVPEAVHRIVGAEYVTLEDGTGLVHTAPGHGSDDYITGLREKLPIYCPVRENGTYDDSVPQWLRGMLVWDANREVTEHLRASGHLFRDNTFMHSYPHDWRGKSPVIFRATEQWFIGVDMPTKESGPSLRAMAQAAAREKIRFVPEWGRNRMLGMLETRPDWCISRQRAWGLPIPAFYAEDGTPLLTQASVRAVARVFRESGSDAWFEKSESELLSGYDPGADPDAPAGIDVSTLRKGDDIFDVWFESGSSWNACMRERSGGADYPVDLYLEGSDQHRGWFQLSLLPGLGMTGQSPYKSVLTHGFIVDKDGHKMSKSVGNTIDVGDLLKDFGADVCRWWVASTSYEDDIKTDMEFFKTAGEGYRKIRNTLRFLLSNLDDFEASPPGEDRSSGHGMCVAMKDFPPTSVDAWALAQFNEMSGVARGHLLAYNFRAATEAIYNFCNDTLSAVYLACVKDRLYCDPIDAPRRRRTQSAMWDIADGLCRLLAPILPHTADEAFRALRRSDEVCVHTSTMIERFDVECDEGWARVVEVRNLALKALESVRETGEIDNPLDAGVTLPDGDGLLRRFDAVDLADMLGVSRVSVDTQAGRIAVSNLKSEPRCERSWKRDGTVRERSDGGMLSDRDAQAVGVS